MLDERSIDVSEACCMFAVAAGDDRTVSIAPVRCHTPKMGPSGVEKVYGRKSRPRQPEVGAKGNRVLTQLVEKEPDGGRVKCGIGMRRCLV